MAALLTSVFRPLSIAPRTLFARRPFERRVLDLLQHSGCLIFAVLAIMVFTSAIRDVGPIALLSSADNQPLSILQLGFIAAGRSEPAAVVGVLLAILAGVAACVVRRTGWHPPAS